MTIFPPPHWDSYQRHRQEIADMLDTRCYTIEWLDVQILNGEAAAVGNDDAVIVVEVKQYPAGAKELHGLVAAGALDDILLLIDQVVSSAKGSGLTFANVTSRPAWAKVLKDRGFEMHQVSLRLELQ